MRELSGVMSVVYADCDGLIIRRDTFVKLITPKRVCGKMELKVKFILMQKYFEIYGEFFLIHISHGFSEYPLCAWV